MRSIGALVTVACTAASLPVMAEEPSEGSSFSLHGGWWDVGAEHESAWGVFGGLGVPWPVYLPMMAYSGRDGVLSADVRLGYSHPLTEHLSVRGLLLSAWVYEWGDPCDEGCTSHEHKLFSFLSVGLRYQFACGFLAGLELPLLAEESTYSREPDRSGWDHPEWFPPPVSAAFTQAYVGYAWPL